MSSYPIIAGFPNILSTATLTSSGVSGSYPLANIIDWRTYIRAHLTSANPASIAADWSGANITIDCWGVSGHDAFTQGNELRLYGSNDGMSFTLIDTVIPTNNNTVFRVIAPTTYKYFLLSCNHIGGGASTQEVGVWYLGNYLEFPELLTTPFDMDIREQRIRSLRGETGLELGNSYEYSLRKPVWTFNWLLSSWITGTFVPWFELAKKYPVFLSWDYTGHPLECYYLGWDMTEFGIPYNNIFRMPLVLKFKGIMEE